MRRKLSINTIKWITMSVCWSHVRPSLDFHHFYRSSSSAPYIIILSCISLVLFLFYFPSLGLTIRFTLHTLILTLNREMNNATNPPRTDRTKRAARIRIIYVGNNEKNGDDEIFLLLFAEKNIPKRLSLSWGSIRTKYMGKWFRTRRV